MTVMPMQDLFHNESKHQTSDHEQSQLISMQSMTMSKHLRHQVQKYITKQCSRRKGYQIDQSLAQSNFFDWKCKHPYQRSQGNKHHRPQSNRPYWKIHLSHTIKIKNLIFYFVFCFTCVAFISKRKRKSNGSTFFLIKEKSPQTRLFWIIFFDQSEFSPCQWDSYCTERRDETQKIPYPRKKARDAAIW